MKNLTMLSFGGGQDSTAILLMLVHDKEFRAVYAPGELIVVMADTGNEHPETYRHVKRTKDLCAKYNLPFFHLTPDMGFHTESAPDLLTYWGRTDSIGSKMYPKTCTDRLKIGPIYKFLDSYLSQFVTVRAGRKRAIKAFTEQNGKINVLIGIAAGEEKRMSMAEDRKEVWMQGMKFVYPLVNLGMDRKACQEKIAALGHEVPYPSNCILCPFMNDKELLWLKRNIPAQLDRWIELEQNKIAKHADKGEKNFGVWGKKLLPEKIAEVVAKFGNIPDEELNHYKFSHGHCVTSKF